tara:strand:+ start:451 stop:930 length:480 start_codon:yes stop_codon:yes gene_type:complete
MPNRQTKYKTLFSELAESKGYKILEPSFSEKKANIDLKLEGHIGGKKTIVSIDIKKSNQHSNQWVYIEFDNSKGGKGWIYGKCQFIVFETKKSFIFIPRKKLLTWLTSSQTIRFDLPYVDKPWNSKYRLFRRKNTLETITQIKVSDLLSIEGHQVWQKL